MKKRRTGKGKTKNEKSILITCLNEQFYLCLRNVYLNISRVLRETTNAAINSFFAQTNRSQILTRKRDQGLNINIDIGNDL